ncbi:MAG: hypothetical protein DBX47_06015 [Clostridiales bacterium]|nr:MAG: hypothetical protein DBX47_06015 [Clostridiales bacterium]
MSEKTQGVSWPLVIIILFIFFPAGIPLLILKVKSEKQRYVKNAKVMRVLGIVLIALWAFYIIVPLTGTQESQLTTQNYIITSVVSAFLLVGGGILLLYFSSLYKKRGEKYLHYYNIIDIKGETNIDKISSEMSSSYETASLDLRDMIEAGFFGQAYVDEKEHRIIISSIEKANKDAEKNKKIIRCPYCGAPNTIYGGGGKCEYCGMVIGSET